jgi:hypothetical protein
MDRFRSRISIWRSIFVWGRLPKVAVIIAVIGIYDLGVAQLVKTEDQDNWPKISDFLQWWDWWVWVIITLSILLVLILEGGYHLITQKNEEISSLVSPRLLVSLEPEPTGTGASTPYNERAWFWRLRITNSGQASLNKCYGAIQHCLRVTEEGKRLENDHDPWPRIGMHLPWARQSKGGSKTWYEIDIAGGQTVYLDYLMAYYISHEILHVPSQPDRDEQRPDYAFYELAGEYKYEFEIAVGSKADSSRRSIIRFLFKLKSRGKATITELYNSSTQV